MNEEIVINPGQPDEVIVVVVEVRGERVKLGIQAAEEVVVHRREVLEKIAKGG